LVIVTVILSPAFTLAALTPIFGCVTVIVALLASLVYELLEKKRRSNVPAAGIVNVTVAFDIPIKGAVFVPFKYSQSA
jgi:hypothetical protein